MLLLMLCFNPRPRAGGDDSDFVYNVRGMSFNPRPRAGGDTPGYSLVMLVIFVSIHAPVRGATSSI